MADFEIPSWCKQPVDSDISKAIRRDCRMYRREKGRGGHRFRFATLKSLWVTEGHAVLNHTDDPAWQLWYRDALRGWTLISWHLTRREAQAAAEMPHPDLTPAPKYLTEGVYVLAGWPRKDAEVAYTMKVACSSDSTADEVMSVFGKIGCIATKSLLAA